MKIKIEDDEGNVFVEHKFTDDKLENFGKALEEADGSDTQKALAFLDFTSEIGKKVEDTVSKYMNKLMGWE